MSLCGLTAWACRLCTASHSSKFMLSPKPGRCTAHFVLPGIANSPRQYSAWYSVVSSCQSLHGAFSSCSSACLICCSEDRPVRWQVVCTRHAFVTFTLPLAADKMLTPVTVSLCFGLVAHLFTQQRMANWLICRHFCQPLLAGTHFALAGFACSDCSTPVSFSTGMHKSDAALLTESP